MCGACSVWGLQCVGLAVCGALCVKGFQCLGVAMWRGFVLTQSLKFSVSVFELLLI